VVVRADSVHRECKVCTGKPVVKSGIKRSLALLTRKSDTSGIQTGLVRPVQMRKEVTALPREETACTTPTATPPSGTNLIA
jgi:hypothetical protein